MKKLSLFSMLFNTRYLLSFIVLMHYIHNTAAQYSEGGIPYTYNFEIYKSSGLKSTIPVGQYIIDPVDNDREIQITDSINYKNLQKKMYYGKMIDADIDLINDVEKISINSGTINLYHIFSPSAYGIQFYFDKFYIPEGCRLFIYNEEKDMILGAFTQNNNNERNQFGTQYIKGNSVFIEFFKPNYSNQEALLHIDKLVHVFRSVFTKDDEWGTSESCNIDLACEENSEWRATGASVAMILAPNNYNNYSYWCSGSLLNNLHNDGRPLFLSASHCADITRTSIEGYDSARFGYSNWIFIFNYQKETCESSRAMNLNHSIYGAKLLSIDDHTYPLYYTDHLLLELNTNLTELEKYNVVYAGWDAREEEAYNSTYTKCIHHPSGDAKKISTGDPPIHYSTPGNSIDNTWFIYWQKGVTEGGSSGSPLFNNNYKVIGQLSGGSSNCDSPDNGDWYNKFSISYDYGNLNSWLDPENTGLRYSEQLTVEKSPLRKQDAIKFHYDPKSNLVQIYFLDNIYPNSEVFFQCINSNGRVLFESIYTGSNLIQFIAPELAKGIYIFKLEYHNQIYIEKILIF